MKKKNCIDRGGEESQHSCDVEIKIIEILKKTSDSNIQYIGGIFMVMIVLFSEGASGSVPSPLSLSPPPSHSTKTKTIYYLPKTCIRNTYF